MQCPCAMFKQALMLNSFSSFSFFPPLLVPSVCARSFHWLPFPSVQCCLCLSDIVRLVAALFALCWPPVLFVSFIHSFLLPIQCDPPDFLPFFLVNIAPVLSLRMRCACACYLSSNLKSSSKQMDHRPSIAETLSYNLHERKLAPIDRSTNKGEATSKSGGESALLVERRGTTASKLTTDGTILIADSVSTTAKMTPTTTTSFGGRSAAAVPPTDLNVSRSRSPSPPPQQQTTNKSSKTPPSAVNNSSSGSSRATQPLRSAAAAAAAKTRRLMGAKSNQVLPGIFFFFFHFRPSVHVFTQPFCLCVHNGG